ncbi:putative transcription factor bHLH family [Medicago truncatula]|uniref:Basic helix loop helix (BHLH) DNA-binding family protein n=1 Tax=Medicago truncatula TaxID=3880 RepID=G7K134_MEDTR|nr:transcription factor bHLH18 [Medicago truncatula]AES94460.2 basic helix loop helix (bHLH) DNA-binding family protein [Medicago truncatula]RHN53880.1 putative transcription factor bHLH family [Medicago truncatula]
MMQIMSPIYVPELGMEDLNFFNQYTMDSLASPTLFDNFGFHFDDNETTPNCFPVETHPDDQTRPTKKIKTSITPSSQSSPQLISFEHSSSTPIASKQFYNLDYSDVKPKVGKRCNENKDFLPALVSQGSYEDQKIFSNYDNQANQTRNTAQAREHVMAERKRREKLTRSFIALSAIVPGLKKMDKASVLGDATKYMKQLQARLQTLEEQAEDNKKAGSTVQVKRSIIFTNNNDDDSNSNNQPLPEIEVRVSSKDVLIKIQCDKHSGRAATVLGQLENLNLTVHSSTFLPFGNNIVDVTIVAQMNKENCVTAKDLLGSIRQALIIQN